MFGFFGFGGRGSAADDQGNSLLLVLAAVFAFGVMSSALLTALHEYWFRGMLDAAAGDEKHLKETVIPVLDNELAHLRDLGSHATAEEYLEDKYSGRWFSASFSSPCPAVGDDNAACWTLRDAVTDPRTGRRPGISSAVLQVALSWRGGCSEEDDPAVWGECVTASETTRRYTRRSLLQYHLVYATDLAPPKANAEAGVRVPFTEEDVLGPIHTNQEKVLICGEPAFQTAPGGEVPVVVEVTRGEAAVSVEDIYEVLSGGNCPTRTVRQVRDKTGVATDRPLLVQHGQQAECPTDNGSSGQSTDDALKPGFAWMSDGIRIARGTGRVLLNGSKVDLSALSDGDVVWSSGSLEVVGAAPAGSSVTVMAGIDIIVMGDISASGTVSGRSAVVALLAGCDVLIDPPTLDVGYLCGPADSLTMTNVAVAAPAGGLYAINWRTEHKPGCAVPVLEFSGAATVYYRGLLGAHAPDNNKAVTSGWKKDFLFPDGFHLARPPWWPAISDKEWVPISA